VRAENSQLLSAVDQRQLILVTGKGGTGKSTLVAALATLVAQRRGRALVVEFSAQPRLPGLIDGAAVRTLNIEADQVVGAVLQRLLRLPAIVSRVLNNRVVRIFSRTSPAAREMIAMDELREVVERSAAENVPVIADLPASGHALSFLDTPRAVRDLLRVGPVAQVAQRSEQLLLDPARCEMVVVTLPEELPVNETLETIARARQLKLACLAVVVNQVPASLLDPDDRPLLDALHAQDGSGVSRYHAPAHQHSEQLAMAREQIERLREAVKAPIIELPRCEQPDPRRCVDAMVRALST
jgi:arsenite/tail-anchored protein-transporting ATPase